MEELDQEKKYHFEKDQLSFVIRRGILRSLLGNYLGKDPSEISYRKGSYGKLYLDNQMNHNKVNFNISISKSIALFGFTVNREIGIDIEYNNSALELASVANNYFSKQEKEELAKLPRKEFIKGFYNCWTRKEAYLKAIGKGLLLSLDQFNVSLSPNRPARLISSKRSENEEKNWSIHELPIPFEDYTASLVYEGENCNILLYCYPQQLYKASIPTN